MTSKKAITINIYVVVIVFLWIIYLFSGNNSNPKAFERGILYSVLFAVIVYFYRNKSRDFFTVKSIFLVSYLLVFYTWPLRAWIFEHSFHVITKYHIFEPYLQNSTLIATIFLFVLLITFEFESKRSTNAIVVNSHVAVNKQRKNSKLLEQITLAITVTIATFFISTQGWGFAFEKYAGTKNWSQVSTYSYWLFLASSKALVLCIMNGAYSKRIRSLRDLLKNSPVAITFLVIIIFIFLVLGDRGPVVSLLVIFYILYTQYISKIRLKVTLLIGTATLGLLYIVRIGRGSDGNSISNGLSNFVELSSVFDLWSDFSTSHVTLQAAVQLVEVSGYTYGSIFILPLLSVIPFAQSLVSSFFDLESVYTSSSVITLLVRGPYSFSGTGTSSLAEMYLSFGLPGVVTGAILTGCIINWVSNSIYTLYSRGFLVQLISIALVGNLVYMPRSQALFFLSQISHVLIVGLVVSTIYTILNLVSFNNRNRK